MTRLILFDVDGTLVDSERIILEAQIRTLEHHGLTHPGREAGLAIVGLSLPGAFRVLCGEGVDIEALHATYSRIFHALRCDPHWDAPLYPGAAELVDTLHRRDDVLLGLATGKSRRGVAHLLDRQGWQQRFATVQTADTNPSKPDPAMVLMACAEAGVAPEATTLVGDTVFDMAMAKAAGARGIGVTWGYHPAETLIPGGAAALAHDFPSLLGLLDAA